MYVILTGGIGLLNLETRQPISGIEDRDYEKFQDQWHFRRITRRIITATEIQYRTVKGFPGD